MLSFGSFFSVVTILSVFGLCPLHHLLRLRWKLMLTETTEGCLVKFYTFVRGSYYIPIMITEDLDDWNAVVSLSCLARDMAAHREVRS